MPDAFGNGLINEFMRANGVPFEQITPLDRLAVADRFGIGTAKKVLNEIKEALF